MDEVPTSVSPRSFPLLTTSSSPHLAACGTGDKLHFDSQKDRLLEDANGLGISPTGLKSWLYHLPLCDLPTPQESSEPRFPHLFIWNINNIYLMGLIED